MKIDSEIIEKVLQHRQYFHRHPELSFQEFGTKQYIQEQLTRIGIHTEALTETGVVALLGQGEKCIALRADMDALPITEETGYEFKSENLGVMHACGHDFHLAILLGAAEILKQHETELNCKIKLIFQPGEECQPGGASKMIQAGVLENPTVDEIYGLHVFPETETGTISLAAGPVMASTNEIYITVKGKGCHAAQPHIGQDPILASANLISYYQSIITKFRNPIEPAVLTIASIDGRSMINATPDKVEMMGVIRTFNNEVKKDIVRVIEENSPHICASYGCTFELRTIWGYPAVVNDEYATNKAREIATQTVGKENVLPFEPKMWAEDFAQYQQTVPGAFVFLGVKPKGQETMPPLHNAKLLPDTAALKIGVEFLANIALNEK